MSIITVLIVIVIIGGVAYLIKIAPIDQIWKTLAYVAIAIFFNVGNVDGCTSINSRFCAAILLSCHGVVIRGLIVV